MANRLTGLLRKNDAFDVFDAVISQCETGGFPSGSVTESRVREVVLAEPSKQIGREFLAGFGEIHRPPRRAFAIVLLGDPVVLFDSIVQ